MKFFAILAVIFVIFASLAAAAPQDAEFGYFEDEDMDQPEDGQGGGNVMSFAYQ